MPRVLSKTRKNILTRARQAKARAQGLCQICPARRRNLARSGHATCHECNEKQKKFQRKRRREKAKLGMCGRCFKRPRERGCLCTVCFDKVANYPSKGRSATRDTRKKKNLCIGGCGRSAYVRQMCEECAEIEREKHRARRQQRIDSGRCAKCGKRPPKRKHKSCGRCLKKARVKPKDRKLVPMKESERTCGKCGAIGHRKSSKKCPRWTPNPNQHGFGRTMPVYRHTRV